MIINKSQENGIFALALEGKLDTTSSPQLQAILLSAFDEANEVVLDFSNLAYVSSAGLRVLLLGRKTSKTKGIPMKLKNVPATIMEVFEITGFLDVLEIE